MRISDGSSDVCSSDLPFVPIELGVAVRVVGLLPRLCSLERDVVGDEDLAESFPADLDHPCVVVGQVVDELADAPAGEGLPELLRAGLGGLDDEGLIVSRDLAGTDPRTLTSSEEGRVGKALVRTCGFRWVP